MLNFRSLPLHFLQVQKAVSHKVCTIARKFSERLIFAEREAIVSNPPFPTPAKTLLHPSAYEIPAVNSDTAIEK